MTRTLALFLCLAAPVAAQSVPAAKQSVSCIDTISESRMTRVAVYLTSELIDSTARTMGPDVDLLTESVATQLRAILGRHPDTLPVGEPRITWRGLNGLTLIAHRNKPLTLDSLSRERVDTTKADSASRAGPRLLNQALEMVRAKEEPFFVWPDTSMRDSLLFRLGFESPTPLPNGNVDPLDPPKRARFLVFSMLSPTQTRAVRKSGPTPEYPPEARASGIQAKVFLQFVIDTSGKAEVSTIKKLLPKDAPPLTADRAVLYERFVQAARESAMHTRFVPASIGGCKVKVLVEQPYFFEMAH